MREENAHISDALLEQAARFRARLADAPRDSALRNRVEAWKSHNPAHRRAFEEAEALWAMMGMPAAAMRRHAGYWKPLIWGAAAAAALWLLAPMTRQAYDDWRSDVVTPPGERRAMTLTDGSRIELNGNTAMAFAIGPDDRHVRMFRGEAFFAVSHDPARPFHIQAGDAVVTVLGTRFNVRMGSGGEVRVTVEKGRVRLAGPGGVALLAAQMQGTADAVRTSLKPAFSADDTAWRRGRSIFYDAPLSEVLGDLERNGAGTFVLAAPRLGDERISGSFRTGAPEDALFAIESSLGIKSLKLPFGMILLY